MELKEETILKKLDEQAFATIVTNSKEGLASRTMLFGFSKGNGIFLLTQKTTGKMEHLKNSQLGLLHISGIEQDITQSYDISASGRFEECSSTSSLYRLGFETLSKKNGQVMFILDSPAKDNYALLLLRIESLKGWNYYQSSSGLPKTIVRV